MENRPESCGAGESPSADAVYVPRDAAVIAAAAHPGREAKPDELVVHALTFHHPQLRDQLLSIGSLLDKIVAHSGDQSLEGRAIVSQFADFQYELVSCLLRERCVLYPRITRRGQGDFSSAAGLASAIRQVEQRCVHFGTTLCGIDRTCALFSPRPPHILAVIASRCRLSDAVGTAIAHSLASKTNVKRCSRRIVMRDHLHIAIADDDGVCREFLFRTLRRMGHEVVYLAENGRQLAEYCLQSPPDLVITDVRMPELDGIAAAAEITRQHNIPIVLLSGSDLPAEIEALKHTPVLMRRAKPVSRFDLEDVLAEVMAAFDAVTAV